MQILVNPLNSQDGSNVLIERASCIHPKAVLNESRRLHEDIASRHEGKRAAHESVPFSNGPQMLTVVSVENCI